jgi:3-deoxy-manno-octulosonate cytidylyltransferase (CMP-KDO synthetase)
MYSDVAIIIPARIGSTRLPGKMLMPIGDCSLIEHTYKRAMESSVGDIYVATDSEEIASVITKLGGKYIMTREDCPSGSDRVYEALRAMEHKDRIKYVVNIQGDMPFLDPNIIKQVIQKLKTNNFDIVTPLAKVGLDVASSFSNVKAVVDNNDRALYFSREAIPHNAKEFWYHVGIYGFMIESLQKFVELPVSYLEETEKLEQLRAIENGMSVGACYTQSIPLSVDTQEDLKKARSFIRR